MLIISRLKSAFKCIPIPLYWTFTAAGVDDEEFRGKGKCSSTSRRRRRRRRRHQHLLNPVTWMKRQMECPPSSPARPTLFSADPSSTSSSSSPPSAPRVERSLPPATRPPVSLLLAAAAFLCMLTLEAAVTASDVLPSLQPCFPDYSSAGGKKRLYGMPCLLSHSHDNYDRETTPEERMSTIHFPLAFLIGPATKRSIRSFQGLEYLLHAFHIPSPLRLIGKIILRILSNSY